MSDKGRDFFVGYLPVPARLKKFNVGLILVLIIIAAGFAIWVSSSQQAAGNGQWLLAEERTYKGFLSHDPYPVLHTLGEDSKSILLMSQGKHSSANLTMTADGSEVQISGFPIERGGWTLLEVPGADRIEVISSKQAQTLQVEPLGEVTLQGEIMDSKCFMGVMKPGEGKVHRACAAMCIAGGIPPMMVVNQSNGDRYGYILVGADGQAAGDIVMKDIAVPVSVFGSLERRGDLTYLRIADNGIKRI